MPAPAPSKLELVLDLKTAKALGLAAPEARPALARAALAQLGRAARSYRWLCRQPERLRLYDRALGWVTRHCGGVSNRAICSATLGISAPIR